MCRGSSLAFTSTLLRSDGNFGRSRRGKRLPWYSCRKLATFFCEVAQLLMPSEAHHVGGDGLLPLECSPAIVVPASTAKIVGNFAPPSCTSSNVCPDSAGHAPSRCISLQQQNPPTFAVEPRICPHLRDTLPVGQLFSDAYFQLQSANSWSSSSIPAV